MNLSRTTRREVLPTLFLPITRGKFFLKVDAKILQQTKIFYNNAFYKHTYFYMVANWIFIRYFNRHLLPTLRHCPFLHVSGCRSFASQKGHARWCVGSPTKSGAPDKACWEDVRMLTQNCR